MLLKNLILILLLHGFILSASAQDHYLLLTKERKIRASAGTVAGILVNAAYEEFVEDRLPKLKPRTRKIQEGTTIKVRCYSARPEKIKGRLDIMNDSMMIVGTDLVLIEDIKKIFVRTAFSKISGPVISGAGIVGTIYTVPLFTESLTLFSEDGFQILAGLLLTPLAAAAVVGCAIAAVGGIIYLINGNVYDTRDSYFNGSDGWHIRVAINYVNPPPGQ